MSLLFLSHGFYLRLIDKLISKGEQIWSSYSTPPPPPLLPKTLLTACPNQLLYNFSLIELCVACEKQNAAVKTTWDACLLLEN